LSAKSLYEKIDYSIGDVFTDLDEDFFHGDESIISTEIGRYLGFDFAADFLL